MSCILKVAKVSSSIGITFICHKDRLGVLIILHCPDIHLYYILHAVNCKHVCPITYHPGQPTNIKIYSCQCSCFRHVIASRRFFLSSSYLLRPQVFGGPKETSATVYSPPPPPPPNPPLLQSHLPLFTHRHLLTQSHQHLLTISHPSPPPSSPTILGSDVYR